MKTHDTKEKVCLKFAWKYVTAVPSPCKKYGNRPLISRYIINPRLVANCVISDV